MSVSTPRSDTHPALAACPPWCEAIHKIDPHAIDHTCMAGAVLRGENLESVAIEIEQLANGLSPRIVLSVFTNEDQSSMNADLSIEEARSAYTALGRALRLVGAPVR